MLAAAIPSLKRAALLLGLTALCSASSALAEPPPQPVAGEVLVVLAKEEAGSIDPQLSALKALKQPPFSSFKSMKVLKSTTIQLVEAKAAEVALPNGRRLQIRLQERMPDGRHKVQVSINRPDKKDYLPLLTVIASEEPFFVAGQKYGGGTLVIGVRVGGKSTKAGEKKPAQP